VSARPLESTPFYFMFVTLAGVTISAGKHTE